MHVKTIIYKTGEKERERISPTHWYTHWLRHHGLGKAEARWLKFHLGLHMDVKATSSWALLCCSSKTGSCLEAEHQTLELTLTWDIGITDHGLTWNTTIAVSFSIMFSELQRKQAPGLILGSSSWFQLLANVDSCGRPELPS